MKTLRRGISYNLACSILEANKYMITSTKHDFRTDTTVFYHNEKPVARYIERYGKLQVIS